MYRGSWRSLADGVGISVFGVGAGKALGAGAAWCVMRLRRWGAGARAWW